MHAVFAICLGACVGALARWQLGLWLNHPHALLPWGTLAANLIGGYLVGLILAWAHHADLAPVWRLMLVTGFLGALTTFSSFSAEVVEMMLADRWGQALTTIALHLLGSLTMTFVGIRTASLLVAR
ncbi:MAG: fluoride efflux transporter CrcB [Ottowia sp.]|jgi:CrcB protein|nr:fluoride efflux transporter CrcB [Ottowia sp.]MBP7530770.1 fluoride efflux transporter CrcB [Ottowia sp.]MBP7537398.1 fluoride efflux transporter CrcB [Ottowia sp.]MBP9953641.1 fluoride efflux transporter CrcB [Ottowia sp.]